MKKLKKNIASIAMCAGVLTLTNTAVAATPPSAGLFQPLTNWITYFYGIITYPPAVKFTKAETTNTAEVPATKTAPAMSATRAASISAQKATSENLQNTLMQFPYALHQNDTVGGPKLETKLLTAQKKDYATYFHDNSIASLSNAPPKTATQDDPGTQASDTLYFSNPEGVAAKLQSGQTFSTAQKKLIAKPPIINNGFLDYSQFGTPMVYTKAQEINASNFVKYAAQSTQNLTAGVDFAELSKYPLALPTVVASPAYLDYMFTVRSMLALRSISINMLNHIRLERQSMPGLGAAAGLTTDAASPLQVEAYQANHRITDKKWYKHIENALPSTLMREQLIISAEREQQAFQAHLDSERLLAAITAMNMLTYNEAMGAALKEKAMKLSTVISSATKPTPTGKQ